MSVTVATWNLNNRVGMTTFRPEAAKAACAIGADVIVLTEYFPKLHHEQFIANLATEGWNHILISKLPTEKANRTLIASRLPIEAERVSLPTFDAQMPSNAVSGKLSKSGLRILGLRVPYYTGRAAANAVLAWRWIEKTARKLAESPALIIGDLNVYEKSRPERGGDYFRRMQKNGWTRATPAGHGSWCARTGVWTELDHALCSPLCRVLGAEYVNRVGGFALAGSSAALSDHSALVVEVETVS